LTSPNREAQEQLVREVYSRAGIDPEDAGFVEAHGTGTRVGDPIEATAIHNVFGKGRTPKQPLYMGSVKSNIGHLENASGVISVIKSSLMLEKGFILPNINFETPNEQIPLAKWNMKVSTLDLTATAALCPTSELGGGTDTASICYRCQRARDLGR
jgi:acyl transferase domain-containing protein